MLETCDIVVSGFFKNVSTVKVKVSRSFYSHTTRRGTNGMDKHLKCGEFRPIDVLFTVAGIYPKNPEISVGM